MVVSYDALATTTLQLVRKRLADAIFKANPFSAFMLANGRVKTESGGTQIEEPLIYAVNSTVKSYRGYDTLDVSPTDELTKAVYQWKLVAGTVSISGEEENKNAGEQAIFQLLRAKIDVLERSMRQKLNEMFLQSYSLATSKDFLPVGVLVHHNPGSNTVGGISESGNTWWQNKTKYNSSGTPTITDDWRTFFYDVSQGIEKPDLILTNQADYELYEKENAGKLFLTDTAMMDVGFENFKYKGATVMWDPMMDDSTIRPFTDATYGDDVNATYFLNTQYLSVTIHRRRNFVLTPFRQPVDQDARVAQLLLMGNLTCSNRRLQGRYAHG